MNTSILVFVLAKLTSRATPWATVARDTGVPYDTLKKIARGVTPNPGVLHVQTLYDYFKRREMDGTVESSRIPLAPEESNEELRREVDLSYRQPADPKKVAQ